MHVANSGRLGELLHSDNLMLVSPAPAEGRRKTAYDLVLVETEGVLVSADARLPNALLQEAIEADLLREFAGYDRLRREVVFHDSRLDLMLSGERGRFYVETKSVTLVECGTGLFPDAPTERGRKHLRSLAEAVDLGHRAAVVFLIQRPDAQAFSPNMYADPEFCWLLKEVTGKGVEAYAYRCRVNRRRIEIAGRVTVGLP